MLQATPPKTLGTMAAAIKQVLSYTAWRASAIRQFIPRPHSPKLSPIDAREVPTSDDLAWAAGLFDGEGCVGIARQVYKKAGRRPTFRLRIMVAQVDHEVLEEFEWAVGLRGRIASPKVRAGQNRVCHMLIYDGIAAFYVLRTLQPFLRRKREHAQLAFRFQKECGIHVHPGPNGCSEAIWDRREWFYNAMRRLNRPTGLRAPARAAKKGAGSAPSSDDSGAKAP